MTLRSFDGSDPLGDKLVRIVYVDEAGLSNKSQESFLVVSGVIVDADKKLIQLERELEKIIEAHVPEWHREGLVLHATELFNGHKEGSGKVYDRDGSQMTFKQRLAMADSIAKLPRKLQLPFSIGFVDRTAHARSHSPTEWLSKSETVETHVIAYMRCVVHLDEWMRLSTRDEICMLVVEDNDAARSVIRDAHNAFRDKNLEVTPEESKRLPLKRVKEDPLFQPKRPSSALQLADFIAYVAKRFLMDRKDERYLRFWVPMSGMTIFPVSPEKGAWPYDWK